MSEKLTIRNFGPIKDMSFELRLVNIFVGDQGTGKSTVSKLYTLIYNYAYYDVFDIENSHDANTLKFFRNLELFGVINYLHEDTEIKLDSKRFQFKFSDGAVKTKHPGLYKMSLPEMPRRMKDHFSFDYIPAERAFVSILADALFGLIELEVKLPTLFNRFGNKFSSARKEKSKRDYKELLGADFSHINGVDTVITVNGKILPLSDASTGIQGTMPMLVVFDSVVEKIAPYENKNPNELLVIEDPELNLFPETQKKVIDYIVSNSLDDGNFKTRLIINTHSPYVLTSLNNLMYAYQTGKIHGDETEKIIDKKYWINPDDVSAYMLLPDGTCEDIFDREENLISAEKIDGVSRLLNEQFEELSNIEYAKL
ncbi:MAG: AAA family ATPase [Bacteroidota bacterium]|nr:AAA family ATPase [Bacteroidota bacterium]